MISFTHGEVSFADIARLIKEYMENNPYESKQHLVIGTDSQNFDKTKVVVVIAVYTEGHGGKFFYEVSRVTRINNVKQKLHMETQMSLECADKLIDALETLCLETGFDYTKHTTIGIHVDAGFNGSSVSVIPEITGWIQSMGFDVTVKPDSFVASTLADRISK